MAATVRRSLLGAIASRPRRIAAGRLGYTVAMTDDEPTNDERVSSRSELLAEEKAVGSDDPEAQAEAILAESDERTASREASPGTHLEHRTSEDTTPPTG